VLTKKPKIITRFQPDDRGKTSRPQTARQTSINFSRSCDRTNLRNSAASNTLTWWLSLGETVFISPWLLSIQYNTMQYLVTRHITESKLLPPNITPLLHSCIPSMNGIQISHNILYQVTKAHVHMPLAWMNEWMNEWMNDGFINVW